MQPAPMYLIQPRLVTRKEWYATMDDAENPRFSFELKGPASWPSDKKQWHFKEVPGARLVRDKFFALQSPSDALSLFNEYGPWHVTEEYGTTADSITWTQLLNEQDFFRKALTRQEGESDVREFIKRLYMSWSPKLELSAVPCTICAVCPDIKEAIRATIRLDLDTGIPWRRCKLKDCHKLFPVPGAREKLYCESRHAHLASMRSMREEAKTKSNGGKRPRSSKRRSA